MSISFDNALGVHEQALKFRSQRAEVLANNLANEETPNYKARDLEFRAVLAAQPPGGSQSGSMAQTKPGDIAPNSPADKADRPRCSNTRAT